jgi:hypothetical protein
MNLTQDEILIVIKILNTELQILNHRVDFLPSERDRLEKIVVIMEKLTNPK